jgi:hypothetical protein
MKSKEYALKTNGRMHTRYISQSACDSLPMTLIVLRLISSSRIKSISHASTCSEYDDKTEMYWSEFMAIFDERRKKGKKSPTQMYNILSQEIGLSPSILASFYWHQRRPIQITMDKIIPAKRNCHYCIANV